jgi:oligopeptide/dipeptide ABC transporter ATP-binding protein
MSPLLQAKALSKVFSSGLVDRAKTVALKDFSLEINDEEPIIISLAGESGSGKSTAANLLLGLLEPTSGEVLFRGQNLWRMGRNSWTSYRREVQAIFQDPFEVFNPFYRVDRVLKTVIQRFGLASGTRETRKMMEEALETVGLRPDDVLGKHPHEISGGQRQRVMIARAFLPRPRLIVADEPVSMLDTSMRGLALEIMLRLKEEHGMSFIYVTHDLSTAYQISDRIIVLYRGHTVEEGPIDPVITAPRHPYTQMLTRAIPVPDPTVRWQQPQASIAQADDDDTGCVFVGRCPQAMPHCRNAAPPIYSVGDHHVANCFLYDDKVAIAQRGLET